MIWRRPYESLQRVPMIWRITLSWKVLVRPGLMHALPGNGLREFLISLNGLSLESIDSHLYPCIEVCHLFFCSIQTPLQGSHIRYRYQVNGIDRATPRRIIHNLVWVISERQSLKLLLDDLRMMEQDLIVFCN